MQHSPMEARNQDGVRSTLEEEMERAAQQGYNFPTDTRETLECAFEAIAQQGREEEEEEIIHKWNEEFGEEEEYDLESVSAVSTVPQFFSTVAEAPLLNTLFFYKNVIFF